MPVELVSPNDKTDRIFIVVQGGRIMSFVNKPDVKNATVFLDIVKNVDSGGEKGLLGLAFHPDFKNNGFFYVNYTRSSPLETVISRFKADQANPQTVDPKSEQVLLHFRQPYSNHNGGKIAFGKDGFLYISTGMEEAAVILKIMRRIERHGLEKFCASMLIGHPVIKNTASLTTIHIAVTAAGIWKRFMPMDCEMRGVSISMMIQGFCGPVMSGKMRLRKSILL